MTYGEEETYSGVEIYNNKNGARIESYELISCEF